MTEEKARLLIREARRAGGLEVPDEGNTIRWIKMTWYQGGDFERPMYRVMQWPLDQEIPQGWKKLEGES